MSHQALPDIGECVIATYRAAGESRVFHGLLSREDDGDSIVWCRSYSVPHWSNSAKRWQSDDAEYDDDYEVIGWVRLPEPAKEDAWHLNNGPPCDKKRSNGTARR